MLLLAVMKLLGEADWYPPRWLRWLSSVRHEAPRADVEVVVPAPRRELDDRPLVLSTD